MGILRLIASLMKAVPVLGRLFLRFAEEKKEQKAQERYEEKLDFIDNAIAEHSKLRLRDGDEDEQREGTDGTPPVSERSPSRTKVDRSGPKKSGRTRVSSRKKVTKKKKKRKTASRRKPSSTKKKGQDILEEGQ